VASRYHRGRGGNDTNVRVVAQVEGTGPVLPILEGGGCVCQWSSGLHKQWQHMVYLELGTLTLLPTLAPTPLPQLSNTPTAIILFGAIVFSCLVSEVLIHLDQALLLSLRSGRCK
jgi:hypothetical protein